MTPIRAFVHSANMIRDIACFTGAACGMPLSKCAHAVPHTLGLPPPSALLRCCWREWRRAHCRTHRIWWTLREANMRQRRITLTDAGHIMGMPRTAVDTRVNARSVGYASQAAGREKCTLSKSVRMSQTWTNVLNGLTSG